MKRFVIVLSLALAVGTASAAAPSINTSYLVTGHPDAAPVQVFDDGALMYVQLRDPAKAPAPFVGGTPVDFTLRGAYLVMPIAREFELRLGDATVRVSGVGMPARSVAQVFKSVDPLAMPMSESGAVLAPGMTISPQPASQHISAPSSISAPMPSRQVTGEILLPGEPEQLAPSQPVQSAPSLRQFPHGSSGSLAFFSESRGKPVRVVADGTVAGANDARRLRGLCTISGPSRCELSYRGAPRGVTTMEII